MQHNYREIYGWMAEGKDVQVVMGNWTTCSQEGLLRHMLNGLASEHFRLKPRTVKIGKFEVEAPVLEPEEGQQMWYTNSRGRPQWSDFDPESFTHRERAAGGRYFASESAAVAAHEAVAALLRGEA